MAVLGTKIGPFMAMFLSLSSLIATLVPTFGIPQPFPPPAPSLQSSFPILASFLPSRGLIAQLSSNGREGNFNGGRASIAPNGTEVVVRKVVSELSVIRLNVWGMAKRAGLAKVAVDITVNGHGMCSLFFQAI